MPNKFTENFNLNQWEKTDKVLMEDFNEDNRKIDEALRDTRPHLIRSWVTDADAASVNFDISGIEWAKYRWVIFDILLKSVASIQLSLNSNGYLLQTLVQTKTCVAICPVFYRDNVPVTGVAIAKSGTFSNGMSTTYRNLTSMTLTVYGVTSSPQYIYAGTEVKIWGIL